MPPWSTPPRGGSKRCLAAIFLLALLLLVPAGLAQASGPLGSLQGTIRNASTGAGIGGAAVQVSASDLPWTFEATTGPGGAFALAVPNHAYTVTATAPAFYENSTSASVGSGQTVSLTMNLTPASPRTALLQGYAKDSVSTAPITQGSITAATTWWASGPSYVNTSALDATGFYSVQLVPGYYDVSTVGVQNYTPFTYSYLTLGAGQVRWYNLSLVPHPLVAYVNGTILDANNYSHIAGATLTASVGGLDLPPIASNATGVFSLHAPTGSVLIAADAPGYAPDTYSVYVWGAGTSTVTIYLTPLSGHVRGNVRDGLTRGPVAGALITASPFWSTGYWDQATSNASGGFSLSLTGDDFDLYAAAVGYTSAYSWAFLSTGQTLWWNVTLWPIVSTLRGYLIDGGNGSRVPGMTVTAYDARSGYSLSKVSDASGGFSFAMPPSPAITLRVFGVAPYAGAIAYPETRAYATTWVNLTLPRLTAVLVATVTDAITGLPLTGAQVGASWVFGSSYALSNATGIATVAVLAGADLTISAWAAGHISWYASLPAFTGTDSLDIPLFPDWASNVTVKGYVRDGSTNGTLSSVLVEATGFGASMPWDYTDGTGYYTLSLVTYPQTIRATEYGYGAAVASVNPSPGSTIWVNLSLVPDNVPPAILSFAASPASNLAPSNPAALAASLNETSMDRATISILRLRSATLNVGTFLNLGPLNPSTVSLTPTTRGNYSVTSSWNTRTPVGMLSDGLSSEWWPAPASYNPFQVLVNGYWDNGTLSAATTGTAVFDTRTGNLLYVYTYAYGYISPRDQPLSTFQPYATGIRIDLTSAGVVGYSLVTGLSYRIGSLTLTVYGSVPGGTYAGFLEAYDSAGNYVSAAALMTVVADSTPPTATAGPDQTVDQGATVAFDGRGSTDNVGVVNYTWTFTDGSARTLYGPTPSYRFFNAGTYAVTLTVRDAAGNPGTDSVRITVLDVTLPTVAITAPAAGANVSGSITITATAADNVGVAHVEILVDGALLGNPSAGPYQVTLDTASLANGAHTITAVARDAAGNAATAAVQVTVYNTSQPGAGPFGLSLPIFGALIAVIAAGVAILILALRRRKKPSRMSRHPPAEGTSSLAPQLDLSPPPPGHP